MPRKKLGFDQRLNFWVSQETYDFYSEMAEKRGEKLSELLRDVLNRGRNFFDDEGRISTESEVSTEKITEIVENYASSRMPQQFWKHAEDRMRNLIQETIKSEVGEYYTPASTYDILLKRMQKMSEDKASSSGGADSQKGDESQFDKPA